jgi:hypothetical protein
MQKRINLDGLLYSFFPTKNESMMRLRRRTIKKKTKEKLYIIYKNLVLFLIIYII